MSECAYALPDDFAQRIVQAKAMDPHVEVIIDGPRVYKREVDEVAEATYKLFCALDNVFRHRYAGSLKDFGQALGHSCEELDIYLWDHGGFSPETFARVDLVKAESGFKIVEFNIGSSVGGLVNASYPWVLGLPQAHPPLLAWARYIAERVPAGSLGVLVEDEAPLPKMRRDLEVMARTLGEIANVSVYVCSQKELAWDGEQLSIAGRKVSWAYPLFYPFNVKADPASYESLREAMQADRVALPISHAEKIFGSKVALAMLYELAEDELADSALRHLVKRWVAWTIVLHERWMSFALKQQQDLVLKPALGFGGDGVVIGREQNSKTWQNALQAALDQSEAPFILQQFHRPSTDLIITSHIEHGRRSCEARCVYGVYVSGGRAGGTPFVRCRPAHGSAVINLAMGASTGSLPLL